MSMATSKSTKVLAAMLILAVSLIGMCAVMDSEEDDAATTVPIEINYNSHATITVNNTPYTGTTGQSTTVSFMSGAKINWSITASSGYRYVSTTIEYPGSQNTYTTSSGSFWATEDQYILTVSVEAIPMVPIEINYNTNATIKVNNVNYNGTTGQSTTISVQQGSTVTWSVTAKTGYNFTSMTIEYPGHEEVKTTSSGSFTATEDQYSLVSAVTIKTFKVTISAGSGGSVSKSSITNVPYGSTITVSNNQVTINGTTVTATASTGHTFSSWSNTSGTITAARTITANFSTNTYTVSFSAGTGGSVSQNAIYNVPYGSSISVSNNQVTINGTTVTATANAGYGFTSWTNASGTVTGNKTITANFTGLTYTVSFSAGTGGSVSQASITGVPYGASISVSNNKVTINGTTVTATASTGYTFSSWTNASGTVTSNKTITANFTINTYTVSFSAGTGGTVSKASIANVPYGSTITVSNNQVTINGTTVTATASTGYGFTSWSNTSGAITAARTITANFSQSMVPIEINYNSHATITVNNTTYTGTTGQSTTISVTYGSTVSWSVSPNTGYSFVSMTIEYPGDQYVITNTSGSFSATEDQYSMVTSVSGNTYTVSFSAGTGGTVSRASITNVPYGASISVNGSQVTINGTTVTATANTGYAFTSWTNATGTVTANRTITANFAQSMVPIEINYNSHATITVNNVDYTGTTGQSTTISVQEGTTISWSVAPDTGYNFVSMTIEYPGDQYVITNNSGSFTATEDQYSMVASVSATTYTVSFSAGTGGTVSRASITNVPYGSSISVSNNQVTINGTTVTATANTGYGFSDWTNATGTVIANRTITANFSESLVPIEINYDSHATITVNNVDYTGTTGQSTTISVQSGTTVSWSVVADTGYNYVSMNIEYPGYDYDVTSSSGSFAANEDQYSLTVTIEAIPTAPIEIVYNSNATITVNNVDYTGTTGQSTTISVQYGTTVSWSVTPDTGYNFVSMTIEYPGQEDIITNNSGSFSATEDQYIMTASIAVITYTVSFSAGTGGTVAPATVSLVPYGSAITVNDNQITINGTTVTATASTGYAFSSWTNATGTITDDRTITANFSESLVPIEINYNSHATITVNNVDYTGTTGQSTTISVVEGSTVSWSVAADSSYRFVSMTIEYPGDEDVYTSSSGSFAANEDQYTFTVSVEEISAIDIEINYNGNATITVNGYDYTGATGQYTTISVQYGTTVSWSVTPNEDYRFVSMTIEYPGDEDVYTSSSGSFSATEDQYSMLVSVSYIEPSEVWWFNGYANGSVEIVFDFTGLSDSYVHTLSIPLYVFNGAETSLEDDPHGLLQFDETEYRLFIETGYNTNTTVSVMTGDTVVKGPISFTVGNWQQYALEIDAQKGLIIFKGIHNILDRITQPFSFVNYTVTYSKVAADVSDVVSGMAIERIYHGDQDGDVHPHFQVSRTTTYLNTYGFVMTDPSINIIEQFPNYDDLRLNFYSFAYYGDSVTINNHTMQVQNADIVLYYIPKGTPIYDPGHSYIVSYYDKNVISTQGNPDAKELRTPLSNIYITWNGIQSQVEEERVCSLTFVDSKMTIDMGNFQPHDLTVSFTGVWYFTTALYEPYTATETSYEMDWWDLSSLDRNGFILVFDLIILIGYIVANRIYVPGFMDKCVVIGALVFSFVLLAV